MTDRQRGGSHPLRADRCGQRTGSDTRAAVANGLPPVVDRLDPVIDALGPVIDGDERINVAAEPVSDGHASGRCARRSGSGRRRAGSDAAGLTS